MEEKEVKKFLNNSNYRHVKKRRSVLKEELVKYKGGKCEICGYNKCIEALEFHHLNREEKDFTISSYLRLSIDKLKKEDDKCILVCANCHREIHHKENEEKREIIKKEEETFFSEIFKKRDEYDIKYIKNSYKYLGNAGILDDLKANMKRKDILKKYHISNETFNKFLKENNISYGQQKVFVKTPSKETLIKVFTECKSFLQTGKVYGVSDNAVRKWFKHYGLPYNKKELMEYIKSNK